MRMYLAARYSRGMELCGYRDLLVVAGHEVQARWLAGDHEGIEGQGVTNASAVPDHVRHRFAQDDLEDIAACDVLVAFTEEPESGWGRGGRHVEMGYALGLGKRVVVIGPRENIFCWLDRIRQYDLFYEFLKAMEEGRWPRLR